MKLIILILTTAILQVSATANAQKITLNEKNASLSTIFKEIRKQSNYDFIYDKALIENTKPVDIQVKDVSIDEALDAALNGLPLTYAIQNKIIVIKAKEPLKPEKPKDQPPLPPTDITGRIRNKAHEPLSGASVIIKRTHSGTISDANGVFRLKNVLLTDTITVSFIGYKSYTFVPDRTNRTGNGFDIVLEITDNTLDQVVVEAYSKTSQRYATGDITTITAADIEKQPVENPLLALQGRVAGLDIQQTSGYASGPILATIRGNGSVNPNINGDPLYVIDGVPLTVVQVGGNQEYYGPGASGSAGFLQNGSLTGPAGGQSPLFSINPSDIESITVLKDADATSIYGSRAANGVILINTKKGKAGKTEFNIHADEGINEVTRYYPLLNTPEYLEMRREAFRNDGITPNAGNAPDLIDFDPNRYTNWQKFLYGRLGKNYSTQLSLSGGNEQTTFRIAGTYDNSQEITSSGSDQRASVSFNLTHHSLNQKLTVSFSTIYSYSTSNLIPMPASGDLAPNAPAIFTANGQINWAGWEDVQGGNPFGALLQTYTATTSFLNSNLNLSYQVLKGLHASINFGYNTAQSNQNQITPIASQNPLDDPTGFSQFGNNSNKNWIVQPQLTYEAQLGIGKLSVLMAASAQGNTTDGIYIYGNGYTSDALLRTVSNAPQTGASDNYAENRFASVFGKVNYNIENKYIFDFNARRDGSSNYGPGHQYGNFISGSANWIFTNEAWFKAHPSFLSFGKLWSSYGSTGSDGGIPYGYITRWSSNGQHPYEGIQPLIPTQHANPDYNYAQNLKLEIAASLGFFKDWVTATAAWYRNDITNQLLSYPTPYFSGFNSVEANLPALVQNQGWEFTIGGKGISTPYFSWAPAFNFSINQNKFVSFKGLGSAPYRFSGAIGEPLNGIWLLHYTGVDPQTGTYTFQDMNHDGVITPSPSIQGGDEYFKKLSPSFHTGFGFNSTIKKTLTVSIFFSVVKQTGINAIAQGESPGQVDVNQPVQVLGRWQNPGDITSTGKFSTSFFADPLHDLTTSDYAYTDASYIRLQNVSLAYNLPQAFAKRIGMTACSVFVHANNLFTITGYKGIDPETQSFTGLPPTRTIVGGFSFTF